MIEAAEGPEEMRGLLTGSAIDVARGILGWRIATELGGEATEIMITDVEAYGGADDPASHASRGRTPRNGSMFESPGTLYVYRSYGVHWCANVVTGAEGEPSAVLIRAGVPIAGREVMKRRRQRCDHLTDGPGKVCAALGITGVHDGTSIFDGPVRLVSDVLSETARVDAGPRVGITKATDRPWRFVARSEGGSSLTAT